MPRMKNPAIKLTQRFVDAASAGGQAKVRLMDQDLRNFGLRILRDTASGPGKKTFIVRFTDASGKGAEAVIGDARQITVEEARKRAKAWLGESAKGADLLGDRKAKREAAAASRERTLGWAVEKYRETPARSRKRERTIQTEDERLNTLVLPILGNLPVKDIRAADVEDMLERVEKERTAYRATHARAVLGLVLAYAQRKGWVEFNAAKATVAPAKITVRKRLLSDAELRAVWHWEGAQGDGQSIAAKALRLALLTLTRATETAKAEWAEIDLERKLWTIPPDHTKKGKEHVVPLSDLAVTLLREMKASQRPDRKMKDGAPHPHAGSRWVFPNKEADGPINGQRLTKAARRIAEDYAASKGDGKPMELASFGPHDLRRTATTRLAAMGLNNTESVLARVLSHKSSAGSEAMGSYLHYDFAKEKRAFLEAWAAELLRIVEGREPDTRKNVRSLLDARREREAKELASA